MSSLLPLFGPVGPEMLIILLVLVLLFGANKIPKLARSTGEAMGEFKKGREEIENELNEAANPEAEPAADDVSDVDLDDEELETDTEKAN
jgi:sec-independent protein translocase protein TatA